MKAAKTCIEVVPAKRQYAISWPNVIRIDHVYRPTLSLDLDTVEELSINAWKTATIAQMAPVLEGKPDLARMTEIDFAELAHEFRLQRIIFEIARDEYEDMSRTWKGNQEYLLAQLVRLVGKFLESDRITIQPALFNQDPVRRRVLMTLNMNRIVRHLSDVIHFQKYGIVGTHFRSRATDPRHRRHADLVHRQAVRAGDEMPYQPMCV